MAGLASSSTTTKKSGGGISTTLPTAAPCTASHAVSAFPAGGRSPSAPAKSAPAPAASTWYPTRANVQRVPLAIPRATPALRTTTPGAPATQ